MRTIQFVPRVTQYPYFVVPKPLSVNTIVGHRRCGKSEGAVACNIVPLINELLTQKEIPTVPGSDVRLEYPKIAYFAQHKVQARNIIWPYMLKYLSLFKNTKHTPHTLKTVIPRPHLGDYIEISLRGAKDFETVRGDKLLRAFLDEYQNYPPEAFAVIYSALADTMGATYISGTAKHKNNILYTMIRSILEGERHGNVWMFPHSKTGLLDQQIETIRKNLTDEEFMREFECSFTTASGQTYFGDLISKFTSQTQFTQYQYSPNIPTILAVDIGVGKSSSAWLAQVLSPSVVLLLDYYEGHELISELKHDIKNDWNTDVDFLFMPHDGERRQLSFDSLTRNKDIFKKAFPLSHIFPPVRKTPSLENDIILMKENLHILKYLPRNSRTDIYLGLDKVSQYGPKTSPHGVITNIVDKSLGVDHATDALRCLVRGLNIKDGLIHNHLILNSSSPGHYQMTLRAKLPSFTSNTKQRTLNKTLKRRRPWL